MKQYRVVATPSALTDMEEIYIFIRDELCAPESAAVQYNKIAAAIESLCSLPERYRLYPQEPWRSLGIRRMTVGYYNVFYIVDEARVTVIGVFSGVVDANARLLRLFS